MAKELFGMDNGFPSFVTEDTVEQKIDKLYNYTYMLLESLRFIFRNLDASNFNETEVEKFKKKYEDSFTKAIAAFEVKANEEFAKAEMFANFKQEQSEALSNMKTYADNNFAMNEEFTSYKTTMTQKLSDADTTAKGYASEAKEQAISEANEYTDSKVTEIQKNIESNVYSKSEANGQFASKSDFTSYKTTMTQKLSDADTTAKGYASEAKEQAISAANGYTNSKVTENITEIKQQSDANGAFIKMMVGSDIHLSGGTLIDNDGNIVTSENAAEFVMQAANGTSTIKLNADKIKFGNYAGVTKNGDLYLSKLFGPSNIGGDEPGAFYLEVTSQFDNSVTGGNIGADLIMKSAIEMENFFKKSCTLYGFRFANTKENDYTSSVNFVVADGNYGETSIIGYNYNQKKTYPKGEWDFSSAVVSGLEVYFS